MIFCYRSLERLREIAKKTLSQKYILGASEGFPGGSAGKEFCCNGGDLGFISGLGRSSGGGHGNPFHILPWGIPWTEEPGRLLVHGVAKSQTQLSN